MLEKDDGKKSIKVDVLPVGPGWDGWLVISERRKGGGRGAEPAEIGVEDVPLCVWLEIDGPVLYVRPDH